MSRVKKVFNTSEIGHLWVNQSVYEARNSRGSFYFENKMIYSYGNHFVCAKIINDNTITVNESSYSSTTAKHMANVRCSIDESVYTNVFYVKEPNIIIGQHHMHKTNINRYFADIKNIATKIKTARTLKSQYICDIEQIKETIISYCSHFKCKNQLSTAQKNLLKTDISDISDKFIAIKKAENVRLAKVQKSNEAERLRLEKVNILKFYNFEISTVYNSDEIHLRINGNDLETSLGAIVPLSHAIKLWSLILNCVKTKTGISNLESSFKIGYYSLDWIDRDGNTKVRCHTLKFETILRVAKQLNLELP